MVLVSPGWNKVPLDENSEGAPASWLKVPFEPVTRLCVPPFVSSKVTDWPALMVTVVVPLNDVVAILMVAAPAGAAGVLVAAAAGAVAAGGTGVSVPTTPTPPGVLDPPPQAAKTSASIAMRTVRTAPLGREKRPERMRCVPFLF